MTPRQKKFVDEYLIDLNAHQAALRAGYSAHTARMIASENLSKPYIQKAISERQAARAARTEIDQDFIVGKLTDICKMDVSEIMEPDGTLKPVTAWPLIWRQYLNAFEVAEIMQGAGDAAKIAGVLKKVKWPDRLRALELLGKHLGMFSDGKGVSVSNSITLVLSGKEADM